MEESRAWAMYISPLNDALCYVCSDVAVPVCSKPSQRPSAMFGAVNTVDTVNSVNTVNNVDIKVVLPLFMTKSFVPTTRLPPNKLLEFSWVDFLFTNLTRALLPCSPVLSISVTQLRRCHLLGSSISSTHFYQLWDWITRKQIRHIFSICLQACLTR